ncbi:thioredoxin domain-containing protein [Kribbella capetownensis]|uniref:Thioredoxin domain-containing protein n=1 Tax=Kribbella capetownensis TaxID=1572659 RepID=A0A4R0JP77_9ACTN|nr:thioredoxin domain-containing protein [Kribbella capetownensis]TCC46766.1 thioredoxin domain-containing protein [Kribbella capetownensis]
MASVNELGRSTSPYLRQHAENPVAWQEWSQAAFAEARERDVPVFLSVGYSACHWCHVMAHESFEDEATAAYLNEHFVCIKVDREERPDVDAIYMSATVAMVGQGGWPMSVFLTPDAEPFFCGTYFPKDPRGGMASFRQVLESLVDAWRTKRDQIDEIGRRVVGQLGVQQHAAGGAIDTATLDQAAELLKTDFDPADAGFGGAPKFPPSMVLDFLLRHHRRTGSADALEMVATTCERMARGGMYDQLAGGFARYSVDRQWIVPHFEKMLYDNALLLDVYTQWWAVSSDPLARRIAEETADFLRTELRTDEGGFASALDADTEGVEGKYYVWTPEQLHEALTEDDARWVIELCDVSGTFEHGSSVLQLRQDPDDSDRWQRIRALLREARAQRTYPGRDDKVVAAWNGLAITALTRAGVILDRPEYVEAATQAARLVREVHLDDATGRLHRTSRDGVAGTAHGVLEDYTAYAQACLVLFGASGDIEWYDTARRLLDRTIEQFVADGSYFDTAADAEQLVWRPQDPTDNASPAGVSLAAEALTTMASVTGSVRYETAAAEALKASAAIAARAPRFAGRALAVAETIAAGPLEIAIAGRSPELLRTAFTASPWGTAIVQGDPGLAVPLMEGRALVQDQPAAYVCQKFTCRLPVVLPEDLRREFRPVN